MISNIIGWILAIVIMICGWVFMANQNNKAIKAASKENQKNAHCSVRNPTVHIKYGYVK